MSADTSPMGLLETYKLHTELADQIRQRHLGVNRFYVTLFKGLVTAIWALSTVIPADPRALFGNIY